jgi:glycosyltransferase involved in cell wall biosynthesis
MPSSSTTQYSGAETKPISTPRVSVVIPVFNGGPGLEKCLDAIAQSTFPAFECILVDDGSTDGMTAAAAARHGARVIQMDRQSGPGMARNRGAAEARGDILLFVDADVLLHPDALAIAAETLQHQSHTDAVFGSYDDEPGHGSFLSQYRNLYHHWVHQQGDEKASTFWAGCGAIRRDVFLQAGGFSSDYLRPSIEDIELGTRLRKAGRGIRLEKTMLCKHLKHWRFWNLVGTDIFRRGVPWMKLVLRERSLARDLNLNISSRIATLLAGLLGLCALVLPAAGHAAALSPAISALLAGAAASLLIRPAVQHHWETPVATALLLLAPMTAYALAPDRWAALPLCLVLGIAWTQLEFYRYVSGKRSGAFAIAVIPMQVLFFLGCVLSVLIAVLEHFLRKRKVAL